MRPPPLLPDRSLPVLALAMLAVLATLAAAALLGVRGIDRHLHPALDSVSETVGRDVAGQASRAVTAGVPFDRLAGVPAYLDTILAFDPRIVAIVLLRADGVVAHARGPLAGPAAAALTAHPAAPTAPLGLAGGRAAPVPVLAGEAPVGQVLVVVGPALEASALLRFALVALLIGLGLAALAALSARTLLCLTRDRPLDGLTGLLAETDRGDLGRRWEGSAPGALGRLIARVERRRADLAGRAHHLTLSAFAARAGHFDPAPLNAIDAAERQGLDGLQRTGLTDPPPLTGDEAPLRRAAVAGLLLAEALLLPLWPALPASAAAVALGLAALPLLAIPFGVWLARRVLAGFARGLIFTAGALIAAAALVALGAVEETGGRAVSRLLTGAGLGMALAAATIGAPRHRSGLFGGAALALLAGLPLAAALAVLAPAALLPTLLPGIAAMVLAITGLLGGLTLPARVPAAPSEHREPAP